MIKFLILSFFDKNSFGWFIISNKNIRAKDIVSIFNSFLFNSCWLGFEGILVETNIINSIYSTKLFNKFLYSSSSLHKFIQSIYKYNIIFIKGLFLDESIWTYNESFILAKFLLLISSLNIKVSYMNKTRFNFEFISLSFKNSSVILYSFWNKFNIFKTIS